MGYLGEVTHTMGKAEAGRRLKVLELSWSIQKVQTIQGEHVSEANKPKGKG